MSEHKADYDRVHHTDCKGEHETIAGLTYCVTGPLAAVEQTVEALFHSMYEVDDFRAGLRDALAQAWREGHTAGRDYQGDGWNSDVHDPDEDNPYRPVTPSSRQPSHPHNHAEYVRGCVRCDLSRDEVFGAVIPPEGGAS